MTSEFFLACITSRGVPIRQINLSFSVGTGVGGERGGGGEGPGLGPGSEIFHFCLAF